MINGTASLAPATASQPTYRRFQPHEWPALSKAQLDMHEHTRCRGFTPEEIAIFKARGKWIKGQYVEREQMNSAQEAA